MRLNQSIINKLKSKINWDSIKEISEGYDPCYKFCIVKDNKRYLLKVFNKANLDKKQREYNILQNLNNFAFLKPVAIQFEMVDNDYYYFLLTWISGQSLDNYVRNDNSKSINLYNLGYKIGLSLYEFHCANQIKTNIDKISRIREKLEVYKNSKFNLKKEDIVLAYIYSNIYKLQRQPVSLIHGDLTETNIIINQKNEIGIIDFGNACVNYSYYDLHQVQMYNRFFSIDLSVGIIDGYIQNVNDTSLFWECFKIYNAYLSLYKLVWAKKYGENEIKKMTERYYQTLMDYNDFENDIPNWYKQYKNIL